MCKRSISRNLAPKPGTCKLAQVHIVNILTLAARTVALYIFAAYIAASAYSSIVLNPLDKVADDVLSSATPEELEEDLKPFFIPFPGTTKQLKPVPYKGSDPEWQEFIKFSKDPKQAQRVRGTY